MIDEYSYSYIDPSICAWFCFAASTRLAGVTGSTRRPPTFTPMVCLRRSQ
jgi:hypothetical protein